MKFIAFVIWLEILAGALLYGYQPRIEPFQISHDDRIGKLTRFMNDHHFAKPFYVQDIIQAADKNHIDIALLPAIEYLESSGCRRFIPSTFNCLGWASDTVVFKSIPDGIDYVSARLGTGHYYAGKSTYAKLRAYNPNPAYAERAMKLIEEIHNE
jgi:hypothetical protein